MNPGIIDVDIDEVKEGLASGDITLVFLRLAHVEEWAALGEPIE
jgi:hypothetical protein